MSVVASENAGRVGGRIGRRAYSIVVLTTIILGATGLGGYFGEGRVTGLVLVLHAVVAPLFLIALAVGAVGWAAHYRTTPGDAPAYSAMEKLAFWMALVAGLVLGVTMLTVMSGLVGSDMQTTLVIYHQYAAYAFLAAALVHTICAARRRRARRS